MSVLENLAISMDEAQLSRRAATQLTQSSSDLSVSDAYAIQSLYVARRLGRGERRVGLKLGLTSRANMRAAGADQPICGQLTDAMLLEDGGELPMSRYIQPRLEAEIVFRLKKSISGRVSPIEAMSAIEAIAPAIELVDNRYEDFKFNLIDLIADNCACAGIAIGSWHSPDTDISNLGVVLSVNGRPKEISSTAAIMGNPVRALVAAARVCEERGGTLQAGDLILSGSATAPYATAVGESVKVEIQTLGSVSISVTA